MEPRKADQERFEPSKAEQERVALSKQAEGEVRAAKRELDEARRLSADEVAALKVELEKQEEAVTRACRLAHEGEKTKLAARHKAEAGKLQASADEKLADERQTMRLRLPRARAGAVTRFARTSPLVIET